MQIKLLLLFFSLIFFSHSFTVRVDAQKLPDLRINSISVSNENKLSFIVVNGGNGELPDSVWTNKNPRSPSVSYKINGKNWGGIALWKADPNRRLKRAGGKIAIITNYIVKGKTQIDATIDPFNQVLEKNESNNTLTRIVTIPTNKGNKPENNSAKGSFFNSSNTFNLFKIKTIDTMQQHVQWVSETSTRTTFRQLRANKFDVRFEDIISAAGFKGTRLRVYVAAKGNNVVVVFRGTGAGERKGGQTFANAVVTDANILMVSPKFFYSYSRLSKAQRDSKVHMGFNVAYNKLRQRIMQSLRRHRRKNLYIFGHSLGGALATLMAMDISINQPDNFRKLTHIVSGSPRVGDRTFVRAFENKVPNNLRVVLNGDPVPTIPNQAGLRDKKKYVHVGRLLVLDLNGNIVPARNISVKTKLLNFGTYHFNKNYQKSVKTLTQKAGRNQAIYREGLKIIVDAARSERMKSN